MVQRLELEKKVKLSLLLCASVAQSDITHFGLLVALANLMANANRIL